MWTNHARFRQSSGSGFVVKPDILRFVPDRPDAPSFDPNDPSTHKVDPLTLAIKVSVGWCASVRLWGALCVLKIRNNSALTRAHAHTHTHTHTRARARACTHV
jgi:hypothetical protein